MSYLIIDLSALHWTALIGYLNISLLFSVRELGRTRAITLPTLTKSAMRPIAIHTGVVHIAMNFVLLSRSAVHGVTCFTRNFKNPRLYRTNTS